MDTPDTRPNFLVLMTDQHRFDALSCRGHPHVKTPNLDRLVSRSVDFRAAYTQAPVCAPARYSLATGEYVAHHGVTFNSVNPRRQVRTVAHEMQAAGYRCFQVGHMHWSNGTVDTGYEPLVSREMWLDSLPEEWRLRFTLEHETGFIRTEMGGPSPLPEEAFWGHYVANESIRLIDEATQRREPFFCWSSLYEPHPPFFAPAALYRQFDPATISLPREAPLGAMGPEPRQIERRRKWAHLTETEIRQMMAGYFGLVELADRFAGRILDHLEALGLLETTWIIWTSDHGEQLFDHELFLKFCMYEQSVHVPFCISGPGIEPCASSDFVEHVDLSATLCDIAGISGPSGCEGRSLVPILESGEAPADWREVVFSQINGLQMARTHEWKLITRNGEPVELYHLSVDPEEYFNCLKEPSHEQIVRELTQLLKERFED